MRARATAESGGSGSSPNASLNRNRMSPGSEGAESSPDNEVDENSKNVARSSGSGIDHTHSASGLSGSVPSIVGGSVIGKAADDEIAQRQSSADLPQCMTLDETIDYVGAFGGFQMKLTCWMASQFAWVGAVTIGVLVFITKLPAMMCPVRNGIGGLIVDSVEECGDGVTLNDVTAAVQDESIISEFNLIADLGAAGIVRSSFFFGWIIGCALFSRLADSHGRRFANSIAVVAEMCSLVAASRANSLTTMSICTIFMGASTGGLQLVEYLWAAETWGASARNLVGILFHLPFAIGVMLITCVASTWQAWRFLCLFLAAPGFFFFVATRVLYESPRWFLMKDGTNTKRATEVLHVMAVQNGVKLPSSFILSIPEEESKGGGGGLDDIFQNPGILRALLYTMFIWFCTSFAYYGISMNAENVGDVYISSFLAGAVEIPANFIAVPILARGRRVGGIIFLLAVSLSLVFLALTPHDWHVLSLIFFMIGKFAAQGAFNVAYFYAAELFPTSVRSTAMGWSSLSARVAGMVAPLALSTRGWWSELPIVLFAGGSFAAAVVVQRSIRETLDAPLLNNVSEFDDAEQKFWRKGWMGLPRSETSRLSTLEGARASSKREIELVTSKEMTAEDIAKLAV